MRVMVTGSNGLLGSHLMDHLSEEGHRVIGVDMEGPVSENRYLCDLTQPDSIDRYLQDISAVVHTAGIPRPDGYTPDQVLSTNTMIGFNLANACVRAKVNYVVNISSVSVLGYPFFYKPIRPEHLPINEDSPSIPQDAYGISKAFGEMLWEAAFRRSLHPLSVLNLRLPWIQTEESFSHDIGKALDDGSDSSNLWAYIDVRDASMAVSLALKRLQHSPSGNDVVFVSARDNFAGIATQSLVRSQWPGLNCSIADDDSLISWDKAARTLGFEPKYSWRDYGKSPV